MAECAGLENRWARKGPVSSNLTSSASKTGVVAECPSAGTFALSAAGDGRPDILVLGFD